MPLCNMESRNDLLPEQERNHTIYIIVKFQAFVKYAQNVFRELGSLDKKYSNSSEIFPCSCAVM